MSDNFEEIYYILEEAIELAFKGQFVVKLYDYFEANHKELMEKLKGDYSDEIVSSLKEGLEKFKVAYIS